MIFERHEGGDKVLLVNVSFSATTELNADVAELESLALSAGADIVGLVSASRVHPDAKYFVGSGKATEIADMVHATKAQIIIFNHPLSPAQERNVEKLAQCRVLDRTGLILDIFAQRAHTHEGKLQVELAQLRYMSTRLIRGWTHLERQKGGIGLRGPGETQLELDRRMLRVHMKQITKRLEKVRQQRSLGRQARARSATPTVSLVGYTNAGKSTLFNYVTRAKVHAADQLFATLDPTLRQVNVSQFGRVIMADTVGFIRHLPHDVVEAFRATLEETVYADLLLHVVDASDWQHDLYAEQVMVVLAEIHADEKPMLVVMNKIDQLDNVEPHIERDRDGIPMCVWLSAHSGAGIDLLMQAIAERLSQAVFCGELILTAQQGKLRAGLHALQAVSQETTDEHGNMVLSVCCPQDALRILMDKCRIDPEIRQSMMRIPYQAKVLK